MLALVPQGAARPAASGQFTMQAVGRSLSDWHGRAGQLVTARTVAIFRYACPYCTAELTEQDDALFCTREGRRYAQDAGIWRLLRRERVAELQPFLETDGQGHGGAGWGAPAPSHCPAPPFP